jgi:hypothetical protein
MEMGVPLGNHDGQSTRATTDIGEDTRRVIPGQLAEDHATEQPELRPAADSVVGFGGFMIPDPFKARMPRQVNAREVKYPQCSNQDNDERY